MPNVCIPGILFCFVELVPQVCHLMAFIVSSNFGKPLFNIIVAVWLINLKQLLTCTAWWVIPLVWLPVVSWLVSISFRMGLTLPQVALAMVGGIFIWTLMEYVLHRFLFHMKTTSYWLVLYTCLSFIPPPFQCIASIHIFLTFCRSNTIHYLFHGCHHKHPMDGMRLVFPPAATAILCVPVWSISLPHLLVCLNM